MTWPQVRALKELHPSAQIDLLVRPKFKSATKGLTELNRVIDFPVANIFEPLFDEPIRLTESLDCIENLINELKAEKYDWVVNSTLSPASSYLTHAIQTPETTVIGYTRTDDGYLTIPDDVSAYIYAQVGIDRDNRIHLADLFTLMVGAQPSTEHWKTEVKDASPIAQENYIVLHVGASRADKKLSAFKWRTFITHFQKINDTPVILIGSEEETKDSSFIALGFDENKVIDLTGKISFEELFPLIKNAKAYLGCDSAPLHIASLVGTPSLNISLITVNFWETGPKAPGSRVLFAETEADIPSETIAVELIQILNGAEADEKSIVVQNSSPSYKAPKNTRNSDWIWSYMKALYMGSEWPMLETSTQRQGLKNLFDVNQLIIDQLQTIRKTKNIEAVAGIVARCEEVIDSIGNLVPEFQPLIRWYQTQKSLIGPGAPSAIIDATEKVHIDFDSIIQFWISTDYKPTEELNEPPQP
jgi:ADP-heptose:LPS heptosyltransferase